MLTACLLALSVAAEPRAKIVREVPHHEASVAADCPGDDLSSISQEIEVAISLGAPAYNRGDHEACYRVYANTAVALDRRLTRCTGVRKALLAGVDRASKLTTYDEKAWAMRDAFDGVLELISRVGPKPAPEAKRGAVKLPLTVLEDCAAGERRRVAEAIVEAIEVGAPAFDEGRPSACYRLYQGTALDLQEGVSGCANLKRVLLKAVETSRGEKTPEARAWAMRDVLDAVLEVMKRSQAAPKSTEL